jgi:hypothetical protein
MISAALKRLLLSVQALWARIVMRLMSWGVL